LEVRSSPALAAILAQLRFQYNQINAEVFMPVGDVGGTYAKEFALGKLHGLKAFETALRESVQLLQEKVKTARQESKQ